MTIATIISLKSRGKYMRRIVDQSVVPTSAGDGAGSSRLEGSACDSGGAREPCDRESGAPFPANRYARPPFYAPSRFCRWRKDATKLLHPPFCFPFRFLCYNKRRVFLPRLRTERSKRRARGGRK